MNKNQNEVMIKSFNGLDKRAGAEENTLIELKNISSKHFPSLKTRCGRKKLFTAPNGEEILSLFVSSKIYVTTNKNGHTVLYSGDSIDNLTAVFEANDDELASSVITRFNNKVCIFNLKTALDTQTLMVASDTTMDYPSRYEAPTFNDVVVFENRVIGCRKKQLRGCKLGNIAVWEEKEEDGKDRAFLKNFELKSEFTACKTYKNRAVFFTKDEMFELRGTNADSFDLIKIADVGCINKEAICEVDGMLYFVSKEGVMRYSGNTPIIVSDSICDKVYRASNGGRAALGAGVHTLYALFDDQKGKRLYTFNTEKGIWAKEDDFAAVCFEKIEGFSFGATKEAIYSLDGDEADDIFENDKDSFEWEIITQDIHSYCTQKKRGSKIIFRIENEKTTRTEVYVSLDRGEFELVGAVISEGAKTVCLPLNQKEYDSIRIKLRGRGECSIPYISRVYSFGGEAV